jgi:hypothetical protein
MFQSVCEKLVLISWWKKEEVAPISILSEDFEPQGSMAAQPFAQMRCECDTVHSTLEQRMLQRNTATRASQVRRVEHVNFLHEELSDFVKKGLLAHPFLQPAEKDKQLICYLKISPIGVVPQQLQ